MASGNRRKKHKEGQVHEKEGKPLYPDLPQELVTVIESVPPEKREEVTETLVSVITGSLYSGPIPPPEMLKQYDEIYPGLSKEIVNTAFSQTKHRHEIEKIVVPAEINRMKRGQYFGLTIAVLGLLLSGLLAYLGHDTVAGIIGSTTLVGLVSVFVIGKKWSQKQKV